MSGGATKDVMNIAVAVLRDRAGSLLLVRKRGTRAFMQPGGKIEPGEDARDALVRELHEELRLVVAAADLRYLGRATAPAANEPGVAIAAEVFDLRTDAAIEIQAEIAEAIWIDPSAPGDLALAPLTRDHVLPLAQVSP